MCRRVYTFLNLKIFIYHAHKIFVYHGRSYNADHTASRSAQRSQAASSQASITVGDHVMIMPVILKFRFVFFVTHCCFRSLML
jgi:hypothetical protein